MRKASQDDEMVCLYCRFYEKILNMFKSFRALSGGNWHSPFSKPVPLPRMLWQIVDSATILPHLRSSSD